MAKIEILKNRTGEPGQIERSVVGDERNEGPNIKNLPSARTPRAVPAGAVAELIARPGIPFWHRRLSLGTSLLIAGFVAVLVGSAVFWLRGGRYATTDDAFVQAAANPQGLAALNTAVTRQAAIVGYINDFKLMFIVSLLMLPLLLMMRWPKDNVGAVDAAAAAPPASLKR